jgi:hypothetical protein
MVSFQRIVLLEAMIKKRFEHGFLISSSLKNETSFDMRIVFCVFVETSLKNETEVTRIVPVFVSSSLKNETEV